MIAGLEEISEGSLRIGDRVVNDVPPRDRDIAMVFQNYALYPPRPRPPAPHPPHPPPPPPLHTPAPPPPTPPHMPARPQTPPPPLPPPQHDLPREHVSFSAQIEGRREGRSSKKTGERCGERHWRFVFSCSTAKPKADSPEDSGQRIANRSRRRERNRSVFLYGLRPLSNLDAKKKLRCVSMPAEIQAAAPAPQDDLRATSPTTGPKH
jgi:hypothetical protein